MPLSVTSLVGCFRQAALGVLPSVEAVAIDWRDPDRCDDWDRLQEVLFDVLVVAVIRADRARFGASRPLPRYGFELADYLGHSFIEVRLPGREGVFALHRLTATDAALDVVEAVRVDAQGFAAESMTVPWSTDLEFVARLRAQSGTLTAVDGVR